MPYLELPHELNPFLGYRAIRLCLDREELFATQLRASIMFEIPSAALQADRFAKEVDFFSIGTNDLVQYTVAVDRMNEQVAELYDYFHPAVIRLIKQVIEALNRHGVWTGMCGSMAGDPLAAPLLIGLGLHEWSMAPSAIQKIKRVVGLLDRNACRTLAESVVDLDTPAEVRRALEDYADHNKLHSLY